MECLREFMIMPKKIIILLKTFLGVFIKLKKLKVRLLQNKLIQ